MATSFNGTDLTFNGVALNVTDVTYTKGALPRVDITHAASAFKEYGAGIPEADEVTVTSFVSPGAVGTAATFTTGSISISGTFRIESIEVSGSIDNAVQYTTTFLRTI